MKKEYDFTNSKKNPYTKILKKQISIRIDSKTIEYFKNLSKENGIPYQNLINLYLRDCAEENKKVKIKWES